MSTLVAGHHASTPNFRLALLRATLRQGTTPEPALIPAGPLLPIRLQDTRSQLDPLIVDHENEKVTVLARLFLERYTQLLCVSYGMAKRLA